MRSNFLDPDELAAAGFAEIGDQVKISRHAMFFGNERMRFGSSVRIDAFCILSAGRPGLRIGRNVHVSAYVAVLGQASVEIGDFATISVRCTIFSSNDDYSGDTMTNPTVPQEYRGAEDAPVYIGPHAILGTGCTVLPGVRIGESAAVGAGSLVKQNVPPFAIVAGTPARIIGQRRNGHRRHAETMLRAEREQR
jgi:acetyltransferase-like isoleucine patch superfamily enzyme